MARRPACCNNATLPPQNDIDTATDTATAVKPVASSLGDYMAPGGTERYRPRAEWYSRPPHPKRNFSRKSPPTAATATIDNNNNNNNGEQVPSAAAAAASNRNNPLLLVAPADGLLPDTVFRENDSAATRSENAAVAEARDMAQLEQHEPSGNSRSLSNVSTRDPKQQQQLVTKSDTASSNDCQTQPETTKQCFFGKDRDPALNLAIRENATQAALHLLAAGASTDAENAKGVTPIILAAQKGNLTVTRNLLQRGANAAASSANGTTAVLQAAHFGHAELLELLLQKGDGPALMELANGNHTTPLMRAAQEGHAAVCRILLCAGAKVNRWNRVQMTALMLAAQRGHATICQLLIDHGAELDAMTASQQSTSLLLACKRGNVQVVRVLVTAGCELCIVDSKGRTAREVARRRDNKELVDMLDPSVQIDLMQRKARRERNFEMIRLWSLLQQERANVQIENDLVASIHGIESVLEDKRNLPYCLSSTSTSTLLRAMTLPCPLIESIAQYLPLPHLWPKRMAMLTKQSLINPDVAVTSSLDLIDVILEEGGFPAACDQAQVTPPTNFASFCEWKACRRQRGRVAPSKVESRAARPDVTTATVPPLKNSDAPTFIEIRRQVGFLQILANGSTSLAQVLAAPPYSMPAVVIQQVLYMDWLMCGLTESVVSNLASHSFLSCFVHFVSHSSL